jgi:hypothetical protein
MVTQRRVLHGIEHPPFIMKGQKMHKKNTGKGKALQIQKRKN